MQIGDDPRLYFCLAEFNKQSPVKHIPKEKSCDHIGARLWDGVKGMG